MGQPCTGREVRPGGGTSTCALSVWHHPAVAHKAGPHSSPPLPRPSSPPSWFLSQFREQVVKETVEKLEQRFQLILQSPPGGSLTPDSALPAAEEAPPLPVAPFSWPLVCSGCHRRIVGTRYQCR